MTCWEYGSHAINWSELNAAAAMNRPASLGLTVQVGKTHPARSLVRKVLEHGQPTHLQYFSPGGEHQERPEAVSRTRRFILITFMLGWVS